jgi:NTE family protein
MAGNKTFTILLLLALSLKLQAQKVGLVFSGGGAKGLAHVGTLKALEENNIPIDYITGTSMGAIVGGMYSAGYSPAQIEKIALSAEFQDWVSGRYKSDYSYYFQKQNPSPTALTAKLSIDTGLRINFRPNLVNDIPLNFALLELFSQASAAAKDNFNKLFVPFRCMASDVISQQSILLSKGSLAEAIRASMAVPLIYRPIKLDDKFVFDGGIYNNFPADVMTKEFKPDVIIGSNVSSKIFTEYPKDDSRIMNRFLMYLFIAKTDSTLVGENGIFIQPDMSQFTSTNFAPVKEIIAEGYQATMAQMSKIKAQIKRRIEPDVLLSKRIKFNTHKNDLIFSDVVVTGVNAEQSRYVQRLFKTERENFDLAAIQRGYYKLVADDVFEAVYPKITYNEQSDSFVFEIIAQPKSSFKIDLGGNISTRPISNVYLGVQYSYLDRKAYTFSSNFYSGRFYESVHLGGRVDFPSRLPLFLSADLTYNHWDYYNTSTIFIADPKPTYIDQSDRKIDLKLGLPLNGNGKIVLNASFVNNRDNYSPTGVFTVGDLLDKTVFNGFRTGLTLEKTSLNRKQYPRRGRYWHFSINYTTGEEKYAPGNILMNHGSVNTPPLATTADRTWLQAKISHENYFLNTKSYSLGFLAEAVISDQPLYSNYFSTLLSAPAFYPLQDSHSNFLDKFRAHQYLAGGLKNIFNIKRRFELRIEGYVFLPYQEFKKVGVDRVDYQKKLSNLRYAATTGLVYQSPLGPVSLSYNLYDDAQNRHGVLLHIGYLIYNKRSLQ